MLKRPADTPPPECGANAFVNSIQVEDFDDTAEAIQRLGGQVSVTDGPFAEIKEQIGGIMVLEATDLNRTIRLLSKHPSLRLGHGGSSWEIRPSADLTAIIEESERRRKG